MIMSLVLTLLVTTSGTIATYLYDEGASFAARLCAGACLGLTALGLIGFVFASFIGLNTTSIILTVIVLLLPLLILRNRERRNAVRSDLRTVSQAIRRNLRKPSAASLGYVVFYAAVAIILARVFDRAMIETPEGVATGAINNFGDLPFHLSVITSFAYGNNFPPEDPTYAGVRFTYPFLTDFISAVFVRCGATLRESLFLENFVVAVAFFGLLHRWALELVKDRLAALATPLLVFLSGGFGWVLLWDAMKRSETGLIGALKALPPSVTVIPETTWRWGNAISTLLVPQRGMLLGLPLAVIVFTQWWLSEEAGPKGNRETGRRKQTAKDQKKVTRSPAPRFSWFPFYPVPPS